MDPLGLTITQLVEQQLPAGFTVSAPYLEARLKMWQLFMYETAGVEEADAYTISAYSDKWQVLLAYLILWDVFQRILIGSYIMVSGGDGSTESKGVVKKITTGPTDIEFHNSSQSLADIIRALSAGGDMNQSFLASACAFAGSMGIQLPFCPRMDLGIPPEILKTCNSPSQFNNCYNECLYKPKSVG